MQHQGNVLLGGCCTTFGVVAMLVRQHMHYQDNMMLALSCTIYEGACSMPARIARLGKTRP